MKNSLLTLLLMLLVLPALTAWLPHGSVHALHDHQTEHHQVEGHSHSHDDHDHDCPDKQADHHPIHFDAVTYFNDYLHIDLQNPNQSVLKAPTIDTQDIDYTLMAVMSPIPRYELASAQSPYPPDIRRHSQDKTPLYLSTQRLRI
jgi:hypothetical protein